ncbi:MAG TPA: M50 family metallopeptidase [Acidobacteriota bacterium]|nr:M50 family metallopeptidase [Acidobacteriota bacterium]
MTSAVKNLVIPIAAAIAVLLLWNTFVVYPLKIFVVFLHELSHGLAAVATGGSIQRIELSPQQGGVCYTAGGIQFFVLSAGYLGSLFWGALLLVLSSRTRMSRGIVGFLGALTLLVTLIYVRSLFGFAYGLLAGAGMLLIAVRLPEGVSDVLVKVIGVTSCLYAVWDIGSDVLTRSIPGSDASQLARITFVPAVIWGVVWILISIAVIVLALRVAFKGTLKAAMKSQL